MERIVINGVLYKCKNGTDEKLTALLYDAEHVSDEDYLKGDAQDKYNKALYEIQETRPSEHINGGYNTF